VHLITEQNKKSTLKKWQEIKKVKKKRSLEVVEGYKK
jgi:hypothetical protein